MVLGSMTEMSFSTPIHETLVVSVHIFFSFFKNLILIAYVLILLNVILAGNIGVSSTVYNSFIKATHLLFVSKTPSEKVYCCRGESEFSCFSTLKKLYNWNDTIVRVKYRPNITSYFFKSQQYVTYINNNTKRIQKDLKLYC